MFPCSEAFIASAVWGKHTHVYYQQKAWRNEWPGLLVNTQHTRALTVTLTSLLDPCWEKDCQKHHIDDHSKHNACQQTANNVAQHAVLEIHGVCGCVAVLWLQGGRAEHHVDGGVPMQLVCA